MHVYFAGPLFTQPERMWNRRMADALTTAGFEVFLPQEKVQGLTTQDAATVFRTCVEGVRGAGVVVAILDGADPDSGTCFEVGMAYALGKPIVAVRTDFRGGGDALPGQKLETINLMLSESASAVVLRPDPAETAEAVAAAIVRALSQVPFDRG